MTMIAFALFVVACLIVVGVVHYTSSPTRTSNGRTDASTAVSCPSARVKLLGVTSIPGVAVTAGLLVRVSVSSSDSCAMSGYPTVAARLTNLSTAVAGDERTGLFGGLPYLSKATASSPQIPITSRSRVVSFTIEFFTGN